MYFYKLLAWNTRTTPYNKTRSFYNVQIVYCKALVLIEGHFHTDKTMALFTWLSNLQGNLVVATLTQEIRTRYNNKYRDHLSRQVVFRLRFPVEIHTEMEISIWILWGFFVDFETVIFVFQNCIFWISKSVKTAKTTKSTSKSAKTAKSALKFADFTDFAIMKFRPLIKLGLLNKRPINVEGNVRSAKTIRLRYSCVSFTEVLSSLALN